MEESAAKATRVIDDLRRQLQQAKAQIKDLDAHNAELKARLASAAGSDAQAFELARQHKNDLTNARGENFELRAQMAVLSEGLRRARLDATDAAAAAWNPTQPARTPTNEPTNLPPKQHSHALTSHVLATIPTTERKRQLCKKKKAQHSTACMDSLRPCWLLLCA